MQKGFSGDFCEDQPHLFYRSSSRIRYVVHEIISFFVDFYCVRYRSVSVNIPMSWYVEERRVFCSVRLLKSRDFFFDRFKALLLIVADIFRIGDQFICLTRRFKNRLIFQRVCFDEYCTCIVAIKLRFGAVLEHECHRRSSNLGGENQKECTSDMFKSAHTLGSNVVCMSFTHDTRAI